MEDLPNQSSVVACCGLYCGSCRKYSAGKCAGCIQNEELSWCKIRKCCIEHGYKSCADCQEIELKACKIFNNFIGKVISFYYNSDRSACINRIKIVGYEAYGEEMQRTGQKTIRRKK